MSGWQSCGTKWHATATPEPNWKPKWKLWFAWHPVPFRTVGVARYPVQSVEDLKIVKWVWLCNVARRKCIVERKNETGHIIWEYAPAHKVLTQ